MNWSAGKAESGDSTDKRLTAQRRTVFAEPGPRVLLVVEDICRVRLEPRDAVTFFDPQSRVVSHLSGESRLRNEPVHFVEGQDVVVDGGQALSLSGVQSVGAVGLLADTKVYRHHKIPTVRSDGIGTYAAHIGLLETLGVRTSAGMSRPSDALPAQAAADLTFTGLLLGLGSVALLVGGIGVVTRW